MKNLKKFVALLLAGVMAMVMLTACGADTTTTTQKEEIIRTQLGKRTEATGLCDKDGMVENDSELYAETAKLLDKRIQLEANSNMLGYLAVKFNTKGIEEREEYVTVTLSASYKTAGYVAKLITSITNEFGKIEATNSNVKFDGTWAKVAVVVRTNEKGDSYAAIAIKMKNIAYKGK